MCRIKTVKVAYGSFIKKRVDKQLEKKWGPLNNYLTFGEGYNFCEQLLLEQRVYIRFTQSEGRGLRRISNTLNIKIINVL